MLVKRQCPCCNTLFLAKRKDKLFCTNACAQSFYDYRIQHLNGAARSPETLELYRQFQIQQRSLLEEEVSQAA